MNTEFLLSLVEIDQTILNKNVEEILNDQKFENIFNRWLNLGFLYGLNEKDASHLAALNEQLAAMLMNDDFDKYFDIITSNLKISKIFEGEDMTAALDVVLFPILRKLYTMGGVNEIKDFTDCLSDLTLDENSVNRIKEHTESKIDAEAEFCNYVCNEFVKK